MIYIHFGIVDVEIFKSYEKYDERPPLLNGPFSDAKGVASQEGFQCSSISEVIFISPTELSNNCFLR